MNEQEIINDFKNGMTKANIAKKYHMANCTIGLIIDPLNLPSNKIILKINSDPEFQEYFKDTYDKTEKMKDFEDIMLKHPFFKRITKTSIGKRIIEIRNLLGLPPKMKERVYDSKYDRIKGYIIRNSKYMASRRGIHFDLEYTDFEIPEYCPILGMKLEYGAGTDGNAPQHATLDRIDNSKGYIPGNVMVISRLANAMKNQASFEQLESFIKNYTLLINYVKEHGTLGNITDIFPHWKKLSLDSLSLNLR